MKARLVIDSTKRSSDLLYLTRLKAPDPVIWLQVGRQRALMLSELELDRARQEATADLFLSARAYLAKAARFFPNPTSVHAAAVFLKERGARRVEVPASFPAAYDRLLKSLGFDVEVNEGAFVPARRSKRRAEVREITAAVRAGAEGVGLAVDMIRRARVRGTMLHLDGKKLTSEDLKREVTKALVDKGYSAAGLIAAGCRDQTSLPHHTGSGPLLAGEAIILDFFPRSVRSGYHGDITRTVVKGRASERLRRMERAVREVERRAAAGLRAGVRGADLHKAALRTFERAGFETGRRGGKARGFFHGLGHGLGLEIHESPSVSARDEVLRTGDVVTIEPGLYYPETGGVRHENVYLVTAGGSEPLTDCEVPFEID